MCPLYTHFQFYLMSGQEVSRIVPMETEIDIKTGYRFQTFLTLFNSCFVPHKSYKQGIKRNLHNGKTAIVKKKNT